MARKQKTESKLNISFMLPLKPKKQMCPLFAVLGSFTLNV